MKERLGEVASVPGMLAFLLRALKPLTAIISMAVFVFACDNAFVCVFLETIYLLCSLQNGMFLAFPPPGSRVTGQENLDVSQVFTRYVIEDYSGC